MCLPDSKHTKCPAFSEANITVSRIWACLGHKERWCSVKPHHTLPDSSTYLHPAFVTGWIMTSCHNSERKIAETCNWTLLRISVSQYFTEERQIHISGIHRQEEPQNRNQSIWAEDMILTINLKSKCDLCLIYAFIIFFGFSWENTQKSIFAWLLICWCRCVPELVQHSRAVVAT